MKSQLHSKQKEGSNKDQSEINKIENRKTIEGINETKGWFFKKINKIDKLLSQTD